MSLPTFLINLARDGERLATMAQQLDALGLPWQRVEAVYGRDLPPAERQRLYDAQANQRQHHQALVDGEIGCYASHLRVWQQVQAQGLPMALVLEDDMDLLPPLLPTLAALASRPCGWDMVKLIGRPQEPVAQRWPLGQAEGSALSLIRYRRVPSLTGAYVISARGAQRLLTVRPPFFRPIDVDLRHWWEAGLHIYGLQPYPVALADSSHTSSIGPKPRQPLARRWRKWAQQLGYSLANARASRALAAGPGPFG